MASGCIECQKYLDYEVYHYSIEHFGAPLCREHQDWIRNVNSTKETVQLYIALRKRGVPAEIEKYDGYKTIDIAIPECKVNIEVDGRQHVIDPEQALSDLQRTYYSFLKGYITLRIPNSLIHWNLNDAANYIINLLNAKNERNWRMQW